MAGFREILVVPAKFMLQMERTRLSKFLAFINPCKFTKHINNPLPRSPVSPKNPILGNYFGKYIYCRIKFIEIELYNILCCFMITIFYIRPDFYYPETVDEMLKMLFIRYESAAEKGIKIQL